MYEDQLSPQLGRLIDAAKGALAESGSAGADSEAVALLTESGAIFVGCSCDAHDRSDCGAAEAALRHHGSAVAGSIDAAAVAHDPAEDSVSPCPGCRRALENIDPELPLVVKQLGRWVFLPLSAISRY